MGREEAALGAGEDALRPDHSLYCLKITRNAIRSDATQMALHQSYLHARRVVQGSQSRRTPKAKGYPTMVMQNAWYAASPCRALRTADLDVFAKSSRFHSTQVSCLLLAIFSRTHMRDDMMELLA